MCVCVCVCMRACVRACVCVCVELQREGRCQSGAGEACCWNQLPGSIIRVISEEGVCVGWD